MAKKILLVDNRLDPPRGSPDLRRYLIDGAVVVARRGPERDLPTDLTAYIHIVLSGSRASCLSHEEWVEEVVGLVQDASAKNIPILGVCFGHQMIARAFGGIESLRKSVTPEFGWIRVKNHHAGHDDDPLFAPLAPEFYSFASHHEEVHSLPPDLEITASNDRCAIQGLRHRRHPVFGVQFHPERNATEGENSMRSQRGKVPKDALLNVGKGAQYFDESIPRILFQSFLELKR